MKRVEAIKTFMGENKPVTFEELKELIKDKPAYEWMSHACAEQLGVELESAK